ncbi:copper chaperone CopZ [Halobacillus halophilus DSM 2266]|uniref:Copper chaperone CopZ n=1 Tax=Halobacillus halophilus (strain ATCC 35676 / DSM 2266 / JCM 20832 / KCTC 3685 / LMG 17431 / NBRC 102448 / NCIMB 2269) TaxID=866895 RepID=I0JRN3_HALH3|nr:copper chaperone CopZ [Halobacillus halophilus DSM 2266]
MQTTIKVEGMTCEHCEKAVTGALKELDGVEEVQVDLATGNVEVSTSKEVSREAMADTIEDQGYDVVS